jgi:hypothetical protein
MGNGASKDYFTAGNPRMEVVEFLLSSNLMCVFMLATRTFSVKLWLYPESAGVHISALLSTGVVFSTFGFLNACHVKFVKTSTQGNNLAMQLMPTCTFGRPAKG